MGILGKIIDSTKALVGGGRKVQYTNFSAGCATEPIEGDTALLMRPQGGSFAVTGFADPKAPKLNPGESMIYSRSQEGGVMAWAIVSPDGAAEVSNGTGSIRLLPDGSVDINGVTIDLAGNLTATTVKEGITNITLTLHSHASNGAPPTPGA